MSSSELFNQAAAVLAAGALVVAVASWWLLGSSGTATPGKSRVLRETAVDPGSGYLRPPRLVGTFAVLCLDGYSRDNSLLMALTLAVHLVVDAAIVMADPQQRAAAVIPQGPDVAMVSSAIGGGASSGINTVCLFIALKPSNEHDATEG